MRQAGYIWRQGVLPGVLCGLLTAAIEAVDWPPEFAVMGLREGYHPPILGRREFAHPSAAIGRQPVPHQRQLFGERFDFSLMRTANKTPPSSSALPTGALPSTTRSLCSPALPPLSPH